jgi:hypothetical protein
MSAESLMSEATSTAADARITFDASLTISPESKALGCPDENTVLPDPEP